MTRIVVDEGALTGVRTNAETGHDAFNIGTSEYVGMRRGCATDLAPHFGKRVRIVVEIDDEPLTDG